MIQRLVILILSVITVAGCALRGPYVAPAVQPASLANADATLVAEQAFDPRWWAQFDDPILDVLVVRALEANHDVRISLARVDQARAIFDEARRDRYPTAVAGASVDRRDQAIPGFSEEPRALTTYRAGFDAFWEIDLFGRVRSQIRAAVGHRPELRGDGRRRARERGGRDRSQLLRAARAAAAARGGRAQPDEPARDAAAGTGPARRRFRRGTGCGERRGAGRGDRGEPAADPKRHRAPRASTGRADRRPAGRSRRRPVAAAVSTAGQGARGRRTEFAAAAPA